MLTDWKLCKWLNYKNAKLWELLCKVYIMCLQNCNAFKDINIFYSQKLRIKYNYYLMFLMYFSNIQWLQRALSLF